MAFIKNNMPDSLFKESIKDNSVVHLIAASEAVFLLECVVLYASICDKGHLVIRSSGIVELQSLIGLRPINKAGQIRAKFSQFQSRPNSAYLK